MAAAHYQTYTTTAAYSTESKEQILIKLYEGAVKFIGFARMGIQQQSPKIRGENISKVLAIVTELDSALDRQKAAEMAENLSGLYQFMIRRLTEANLKNNLKALDEVETILLQLKEAFEAALPKPGLEPEIRTDADDSAGQRKEVRLAV